MEWSSGVTKARSSQGHPTHGFRSTQGQGPTPTLTGLVRGLQGVEDAVGAACRTRGAGGAGAPHFTWKPTGARGPQEA